MGAPYHLISLFFVFTGKTKDFLFANTGMSDGAIGAILLIVSLALLCVMLVVMVKLLNSLMQGNVARIVKKTINTNFPKPFGWLTGKS